MGGFRPSAQGSNQDNWRQGQGNQGQIYGNYNRKGHYVRDGNYNRDNNFNKGNYGNRNDRNGLPRIMGTSKSTSQSRITKYAGNMNDSIVPTLVPLTLAPILLIRALVTWSETPRLLIYRIGILLLITLIILWRCFRQAVDCIYLFCTLVKCFSNNPRLVLI